MADIRELVQQTAPQVDDLDLDAVRSRAQAVRASHQRRQRLTFGTVAGVLILVVALVASPLLRGGGRRGAEIGVGGQSPLAGISGPSVLGQGDLSLGDFAGQPLLIHIWAPWCGPCIDGLSDLQTVADEIGGDGDGTVQLVTIAVQTDLEQVVRAIDQTGVALPTMLLAEPDVLAAVLQGLPTTIAVNADHEVVETWLGAVQVDALRDMAELAATVTEPPPHVTDLAYSTPAPSELDSPLPVIFPPSPNEDGMHVDPSPNPYPDEGIRMYEVQGGDTLSTIAEAMYGDPLAFSIIAEANGLTGDAPLFVGQQLVIPPEGCCRPTTEP